MGNCQNFKATDDPISPSTNRGLIPFQLIVKTFTWNRDSHGLFDYENKIIYKDVLKIFEACYLSREKNSVKSKKNIPIDENHDNMENSCLTHIIMKNNNYFITSDIISHSQPQMELDGLHSRSIWIVVKSLKIFKLSQGDFIKLGRIRFKIKEFGIHSNSANIIKEKPSVEIETPGRNLESRSKNRKSQFLCRICLSDVEEIDNPFVTPCSCSGTMQFIHIKCLQSWLNSRLQIKQTSCSTSFLWKNFECELCKKVYPNFIECDGRKYDIVEIPKQEGPYLILEILSRDRNQSRGVHILNLGAKNYIKLGRGHDCDIRIPDISVSRLHAGIKYEKGSFFIEDNSSKFGTLVLLKAPMLVDIAHNHLTLQVGRTVLYFTVKKCSKKVYKAKIGNIQKSISNLTDSSEIDTKRHEEERISLLPNDPARIENEEEHNNEDIIQNLEADAPEEEPEREVLFTNKNRQLFKFAIEKILILRKNMLFKESFFIFLKNNEKRKKVILNLYRNLLKLAVGFQKYDKIVANYIKIKVISEFDAHKLESNSNELLNLYSKAEKSRKKLKNALVNFQNKNFEDKNVKIVIMAAYGCRFDDNRFLKYWEKKDKAIYKNLLNTDKKGFLFNFPLPCEFSEYILTKKNEERRAYICLEEPDFDEFMEN